MAGSYQRNLNAGVDMKVQKQESDDTLFRRFLSGDTGSYDQLMIRYGDSLTTGLLGYALYGLLVRLYFFLQRLGIFSAQVSVIVEGRETAPKGRQMRTAEDRIRRCLR